jgi:FkbM family methyltransferase
MLLRDLARCVLASALHQLKTVKIGVRIANSRLGVWACGEGPAIASLRYGARALVFAEEYSGRAMYLWGEVDPRISSVITAVLRDGDTFLDIGANFGVIGLLAAKRVGPTGTVHLIEPQPFVAQCLRASLLINGFSHAIVHECALSDKSGSAIMTSFSSTDTSTATLSMSDIGPIASRLAVRVERADTYMASLGCRNVDVIKIDVEGHEPVILALLRDWLADVRPPVILFECHLGGTQFNEHASVRILSGLGYDFLNIDTGPFWHTRLFAPSETRPPCGRDFVALHWEDLDDDRRNALRAMIS